MIQSEMTAAQAKLVDICDDLREKEYSRGGWLSVPYNSYHEHLTQNDVRDRIFSTKLGRLLLLNEEFIRQAELENGSRQGSSVADIALQHTVLSARITDKSREDSFKKSIPPGEVGEHISYDLTVGFLYRSSSVGMIREEVGLTTMPWQDQALSFHGKTSRLRINPRLNDESTPDSWDRNVLEEDALEAASLLGDVLYVERGVLF